MGIAGSTHGLWAATAPPAPPTDRLREAITADVAIVGGGYTGLSAALHLQRMGVSAVVLEGREIGFGGAGRNVGLVNAGLWVMPDDIAAGLGPERGERLIELLGQGPSDVFALVEHYRMACEAVRTGTLHLAVGPTGREELENRTAQWQRRGAPVELLDGEETRRRVGGGDYAAALLDRRAGTIQPLAYARGLAEAVLREGGRIHTDSGVLGLDEDGGLHVLRTTEGEVRSRWVIVATDAYGTDRFAATGRCQVPLPYFNLATRPLGDNVARTVLPNREGAWDTREVLSSFRMDAAGRLVVGSVGALRGTGASVHRAWARREIARLFPQVGDVEFEEEWYGTIGMTADALPRLFVPAQRILGVCGYNGRGISPGTVFGRLLAEVAAGRQEIENLPLPVSRLDPAAFRRWKGAFYEIGSQVAHLASRGRR